MQIYILNYAAYLMITSLVAFMYFLPIVVDIFKMI